MGTILQILRWLAVIPSAWLASLACILASGKVGALAERLAGEVIGGALHRMLTVIAYFFYGFLFVAVGGWVAPSHNMVVVVLFTVFSIIEAWRRCFIFGHFTKFAYLNGAAAALGALTVATNW